MTFFSMTSRACTQKNKLYKTIMFRASKLFSLDIPIINIKRVPLDSDPNQSNQSFPKMSFGTLFFIVPFVVVICAVLFFFFIFIIRRLFFFSLFILVVYCAVHKKNVCTFLRQNLSQRTQFVGIISLGLGGSISANHYGCRTTTI